MRSTAFTALLSSLIRERKKKSAAEVVVPAEEPINQKPAGVHTQSPSKPGVLFWTDGKARTMPVALRAVAMLTLLAFVAWLFVIGGLMVAAPFSRLALTLAVMSWMTLLLPCQVWGHLTCLRSLSC